MSNWNPPETAPFDKEFLALLDNGWIIIINSTPDPDDWPYQWWRTSFRSSIPIEPTHGKNYDWSKWSGQMLAGWQELPEGDLELINTMRQKRNINEFTEL